MRASDTPILTLSPIVFMVWAGVIFSSAALAVEPGVRSEISALLEQVAISGCAFERNGKQHSSADAADHLALKFKRGERYVTTTEDFIDRLASESSWSGKPYLVVCNNQEATSRNWLHNRLIEIRAHRPQP